MFKFSNVQLSLNFDCSTLWIQLDTSVGILSFLEWKRSSWVWVAEAICCLPFCGVRLRQDNVLLEHAFTPISWTSYRGKGLQQSLVVKLQPTDVKPVAHVSWCWCVNQLRSWSNESRTRVNQHTEVYPFFMLVHGMLQPDFSVCTRQRPWVTWKDHFQVDMHQLVLMHMPFSFV